MNKPFHLLLALFTYQSLFATTTNAQSFTPYICDIPSNGCTNGIFNQGSCECECIPPFCHDAHGDCTVPSSDCGGNPWKECTKGINCPWWKNPLRAESCTTDNEVPRGIWDVYNSEEACCKSEFAFNHANCYDPTLSLSSPTKYPTISLDEYDEYEVIPLRFDISGLPNNVQVRKLRQDMKMVLRRILVRLSEQIDGLRITNIEERGLPANNRLLALRTHTQQLSSQERALVKDVSLFYNVHVVRSEDGSRFGPLIVSYMRDNFDEVMDEIQTSPDTINYFNNESVEMNFVDEPAPSPSTTIYAPPINAYGSAGSSGASIQAYSDSTSGDDGLEGWAIFLIILLVLVILCCAGYLIFLFCFNDRHEDKPKEVVHNNIYLNKKRVNNIDDTNMSIQKSVQVQPEKKKKKKDPTFYMYEQEGRLDPEAGRHFSVISRKYYNESDEPPTKPKRDPTMYIDGKRQPTVYVDDGDSYMVDSPRKKKRDPSMYIEKLEDDEYGIDESGRTYAIDQSGRTCDEEPQHVFDESYRTYIDPPSELDYMNSIPNSRFLASGLEVSAESIRRTHEPSSVAGSKTSKRSSRNLYESYPYIGSIYKETTSVAESKKSRRSTTSKK